MMVRATLFVALFRSLAYHRPDPMDTQCFPGIHEAWAFTRCSSDYISQERAAAIGAGLGVHAHNCEKPWDWRARKLTP
jgi:hypothetical protein